jgi:hypothetical protein
LPHNRHPPRTHHPTPFLFILLKLQTGWGFPRPIFTQHYGSRAARVDSRASFLPSITVPAPHGWIPAPHFCPALRFPRRTGGFPRPIFTQHYGSRAARVDSRAPFFCSITVPAPHGWVPAPHFYSALRFPRRSGENPRSIFLQYHGSRAAPVGSRAPFFCSISVPAPQRWVPAPHFSAALRFPRRTGGFPRPIFMQHHGSRAARVDSRAPFLCSIAVAGREYRCAHACAPAVGHERACTSVRAKCSQ